MTDMTDLASQLWWTALASLEVVILTASVVANDDNSIKVTTFLFGAIRVVIVTKFLFRFLRTDSWYHFRLFDSQNNNRGGYNEGSLYYYVGSKLPIEW